MKSLTMLCAAALLFSGETVGENNDDTAGTISGKITFDGEKPEAKPDLVMKDAELAGCCDDPSKMDKKDATLVIDGKGGVANVVVTLTAKGYETKLPTDPVVFDQKGCRFVPHVAVVPVGASVAFKNSDGTNHNIHTYSRKNEGQNENVAAAGKMVYKPEHAETITVKCDIHPWMKGYVIVTDETHFAVSSADGSFEIKDVPPGEYTLNVWHEELGKSKTSKVTVEAGKVATVAHKVGAKKKKKGGGRRRR